MREDPPPVGKPDRDQVARGGEKIAERIGFVFELTLLVPAPPLFGAAAHMRDGVDEAAIDQ